MTQDFAAFLDVLNSEGAAYVVIGGMAVMFHVPYRTTRELEVLIEPTLENAVKVRAAVAATSSSSGSRCRRARSGRGP